MLKICLDKLVIDSSQKEYLNSNQEISILTVREDRAILETGLATPIAKKEKDPEIKEILNKDMTTEILKVLITPT